MSLWESSFVTKQSHLDSSGKRLSHMLSHRLRVTKSPSGSAGHMSACGCLGFSALYRYANTHRIVSQHMCTPPYPLLTFKCHTDCVSVEGCYLAVWGRVSLSVRPLSSLRSIPARQKHISSSVCLKPRNLLLHVREHEGKNGTVREKK